MTCSFDLSIALYIYISADKCNQELLAKVDKLLLFAFHDSSTGKRYVILHLIYILCLNIYILYISYISRGLFSSLVLCWDMLGH